MSTRSAIGAETESGTRAVYVHSDGYPDGHWGKVEVLRRLVAKHGVSRVVSVLLETPAGWSSFDGEPGEELSSGHTDGRFELVPDFGVRYTLTVIPDGPLGKNYVQGNKEYFQPGKPIGWDVEYVYIISADGKTLRWAEHNEMADDTDWDSLEWQKESLI